MPANSASNTGLLGLIGGVNGQANWSGTLNGGFQLGWNITQSGPNYNYIYTISNASGGSLSRGATTFVLQLDPSITPSNLSTVITGANQTIVNGPRIITSADATYLPASIYGIEFNMSRSGTTTISFTSTNAPVWGSFYADNGFTNSNRGDAYNVAFGGTPTLATLGNYVPTVGAMSVIAPEPSTMLILGTMLSGVLYFQRRRMMSKSS